MALVGFSFTKIVAEKKPVTEHNVKVDSNVSVNTVTELNISDAKKSLLKFEFTFLCKYEPGVGSIEFSGEMVEIYDKEFGVRVVESWGKDKKLPKEILASIFNTILTRSNIEAIVISREIGLPSPLQMPKLEVKAVEKINDAKGTVKADAKADAKPKKK